MGWADQPPLLGCSRAVAGGRGFPVRSLHQQFVQLRGAADPVKTSRSKPQVVHHSCPPPKFQTKKSILNSPFTPLKELDYKLLEVRERPPHVPFLLQRIQSVITGAFGEGVPMSAPQSAAPPAGSRPPLCPAARKHSFPTCSTRPEVFNCRGLGVSGLLVVCLWGAGGASWETTF